MAAATATPVTVDGEDRPDGDIVEEALEDVDDDDVASRTMVAVAATTIEAESSMKSADEAAVATTS